MSDYALPLCACEQYYESHHPECPARRAHEAALLKLDRYEQLLATAYQLAGLVGAPVRFLDAYALHDGTDADSLLPVGLDELEEFKALQFRLDSAENAMREVVSHLQRSQRGSTHWAGCPDVHPVCKAIDMLVDALPLPRAGETEHPEMWCGDCGRPNVIWFAPNKLWNQVMGSPNGIVCPACFAIRADRAGVSGVWRFDLHDARAVETPVNQRGE